MIVIRYTGPATPVKKVLHAALREAYEALGVIWHEKMLPRHFTREGAQVYHYQKRTPGYMKRKGYKLHMQLPLVWSGDTRAMTTMARRVRATSNGVTVTMTAPRYIYRYRKDLLQPDKYAELTRISTDEVVVLSQRFKEIVEARLDAMPMRRRTV